MSAPGLNKQAICIAGESGAGKTESTKQNLKALTMLGLFDPKKPDEKPPASEIVTKIMACNPVLESWGNA